MILKKACLAGVIALSINSTAIAQTAAPTFHPLSTENGRYVFGQIGPVRADQYMLDTKTGRMWQVVLAKDKTMKLQYVSYILVGGGESLEAMDQEAELARTQKK